MDFPPEIVEKILSFLDGKSLGRVCLVNKSWNREVKRLTEKLDTWRRCVEEIPKTNLIELATNLDLHLPPSQLDNVPDTCLLKDWRSVYINWWMWTHLSRWSTCVTTFSSLEEVTCAKLSGECIVTGHASGEIRVWSIKGTPLAFCLTHRRKVKDLLMVAFGPEDMFNVNIGLKMSDSSKLGMAHQCVISTSPDEQLAITYFVGKFRDDGLMKFNRPDYFLPRSAVLARLIPTTAYLLVVIYEDRQYTGKLFRAKWNYDTIEHKVKLVLTIETEFLFPGQIDIKTVSCYPPKTIAALTNRNDCHSFMRINLEVDGENRFTFTPLCPSKDFMQDVNIFRANICIWIENSMTTRLHVHCNDSTDTINEVRPALSAVPVCYLLHGPILFIGTSMGSVLAYDARNLPMLELDKPRWSTHLQCDPITAIHVSGGPFGLRLVAATDRLVFFVHFNTVHCMPARSLLSDRRDESVARLFRNWTIE